MNKYFRSKAAETTAVILLGAGSFLNAQEPVEVHRGARPAIPDSLIHTGNCLPGVIRIKLTPEAQRSSRIRHSRNSNSIETSLSAIDELNNRFGVSEMKPTFNLYKTQSRAVRSRRALHHSWGFDRWYDITIANDSITQAVEAYNELAEVALAEPIFRKVRNSSEERESSEWIPNDPEYSKQWHYHSTGQKGSVIGSDINLQKAWYYERGFEEILVAVVDGGLELDHPDLKANIWEGKGYNFVDGSETIVGDYHGTHVGGTVAAVNNNGIGVSGVAGGSGPHVGDGIRMMSCQIFSATAFGGSAEALIWAADNGAVISQNSWSYGDSLVFNQSDLDAIDYFNANGGGDALVGGLAVFSAGNRGLEGTYYPGCYEGAFSVASIDNEKVRASYSNHGDWVDITAPGGDKFKGAGAGVYSTDVGGDYKYLDGTSMACPHVSGVAALIVSAAYRNGIVLTADELKEILQKSADNIFTGEYLGKMGAGLVNAGAAFTLLNKEYLTDLQPPYEFSAELISGSGASLKWRPNDAQMPVIVTVSRNGDFTAPVDGKTYTAGDMIGNSEVIYVGSETTALHTGLKSKEHLQYRIYSSDNNTYSGYRTGFVITDHFDQSGTAEDPYLINTLEELKTIMSFPRYWDNHIRLTASINAASTREWNKGRGWTPIGHDNTPFSGVFMGGGHTIDSLYINKDSDFNSFFGVIKDGTVDSLGMRDVHFTGKGFTAGFVGRAIPGTISNCFATGSVNGNLFTGGFAGLLNNATVSDCYARVTVKGGWNVGGFAGSCYQTTISNCYTAGSIQASGTVGGFAGVGDAPGTCYWDKDVAQVATSKGGTAVSTEEMQKSETFSNWDFTNIWKIPENGGYPLFTWEKSADEGVSVVVKKSSAFGAGVAVETNPVARTSGNGTIVLTTAVSGSVVFTVFDALGAVLAESEEISIQNGKARFVWDLTNKSGSTVCSGSYLIIAKVKSQGAVEYLKEIIGVFE